MLPSRIRYPYAKRIDDLDDYGGVKVSDPYRWLEDADSAETQAWVLGENKVTFEYLAGIPGRAQIAARLTQLFDRERFSGAFQRSGRYFFFRNDGLQNQNVLYAMDGLTGEPKILLDPNTLREDGTVALSGISVTSDGKLLAYSIAQAGSDWNEWRVRDVSTGQDRTDLIQWDKTYAAILASGFERILLLPISRTPRRCAANRSELQPEAVSTHPREPAVQRYSYLRKT